MGIFGDRFIQETGTAYSYLSIGFILNKNII